MWAIITAAEVVPAYSELEVMATISQYCKSKSLVLDSINTKATVMAARALHPSTTDHFNQAT